MTLLNRRQMLAGLAAPLFAPDLQRLSRILHGESLLNSSAVESGAKGGSMHSQYTSNAQIRARWTPGDFPVDGDTSKPEWQSADWISFDQSADGSAHYPDIATRAAALWTENYLYIAFRSPYSRLNIYHDADPKLERWELWERDVVEVFLNPQPERMKHYYEFEVAPNNQWLDLELDLSTTPPSRGASWNSGFDHATKIDSSRHIWTCEMRIPYKPMNAATPTPGAEWRINLFRAEGFGDKRRQMAWSDIPGSTTFHVPARFGIMRFEK